MACDFRCPEELSSNHLLLFLCSWWEWQRDRPMWMAPHCHFLGSCHGHTAILPMCLLQGEPQRPDVVQTSLKDHCLKRSLSKCSFFDLHPVQVVQEYERAVIFRLGRLLSGGSRGPGESWPVIVISGTEPYANMKTILCKNPRENMQSIEVVRTGGTWNKSLFQMKKWLFFLTRKKSVEHLLSVTRKCFSSEKNPSWNEDLLCWIIARLSHRCHLVTIKRWSQLCNNNFLVGPRLKNAERCQKCK